jgi:hypothetical protein
LLRLLARIQERPVIIAVVGIALELGIMSLAGSDDAIRGVRGIGGETASALPSSAPCSAGLSSAS